MKSGELTDRALERILRLIPHDLRLYEHALRLFQVRCMQLLGRRPEEKRLAVTAA